MSARPAIAYPPLELGQPGNPACPDNYNNESTLVCVGAQRLVLQISVNAVFVQLGIMPQGKGAGTGAIVWQPEQPYLPMISALSREFDAVRVRNYTPGAKAQVLINPA